MHVVVVIVTRSVSIAVKTLHSLLAINRTCAEKQVSLEIAFVNDDAFERKEIM